MKNNEKYSSHDFNDKDAVMKIERDKIIFESRREIEGVQIALGDYLESHKSDDNYAAQKLYDLLDVMHMSW